jgi:hypothetical protein
MVADRGKAPSGQVLTAVGFAAVPPSPGCWMFTNSVVRSGVAVMPVISQPLGPTRKRLTSPVSGVREQHLVVAGDRLAAVGLDPQPTVPVEPQAVR